MSTRGCSFSCTNTQIVNRLTSSWILFGCGIKLLSFKRDTLKSINHCAFDVEVLGKWGISSHCNKNRKIFKVRNAAFSKEKFCFVLYRVCFLLQQYPWIDHNQQRTDPTHRYSVYIWIQIMPLCQRASLCPKTIKTHQFWLVPQLL